MSGRRAISKYANRRLYDPVQGRYITLEDIRKLVNDHVEFVITDRKTGTDITCSVLAQVVACEEKGSRGVFRRDFLLDLIRSGDAPGDRLVGAYLERALAVFVKSTAALQSAHAAAGEGAVNSPVPPVEVL